MSKEDIEKKIKKITSEIYPWARDEVMDAESKCGRNLLEIWMKDIRNGLDRLSYGIKNYYQENYDEAENCLSRSETRFIYAVREAWLVCLSLLLESLEKYIKSPFTRGDKKLAKEKAQEAQDFILKGRTSHTESPMEGISYLKQGVESSIEGLFVLSSNIPSEIIFWVGIASILVSIILLYVYS